jgi:microsomal dipeptidase-like Zn-dependent dipeptidase
LPPTHELTLRRFGLALAVLVALALAVFFFGVAPMVDRNMNQVVGATLPPPSTRAAALHRTLAIADLHADPLLWPRDLDARANHGHIDVPRLLEGNVALQVFSIVTKTPRGQNYLHNDSTTDNIALLGMAERWPVRAWNDRLERAIVQAERLREAAARSNGSLVLVRSAADLDTLLAARARGARVVGGLLSIEGAHALAGRIESLDTLAALGVRMIGLAHFFDNEFAGSSAGMTQGGLTPLGRALVTRMEARGILVDVAHTAPKAIDEVLAMATKPVVVSHTGVKGTCESPRNLSDDQLRRIAATGGVIGIGYWDGALCADISPASFARAVTHAIAVAGVDHIALGSDFDGATKTRFDVSQLAVITEALLAAGLDSTAIAKVEGENAIEVLRRTMPAK